MRFNLALIYDPEKNTLYSIFATAVTVYFYAYSLTYGQIGILITYAVWFPLFVVRPNLLMPRLMEWVIFAFPIFALLSGIWADAAGASLRFGIQLMTTMLCAYLAGRVVSTGNLLLGLVVGCTVTGLVALADGTTGMSGEKEFLIGWFGSKNQLGLVVAIGALAALTYPIVGLSVRRVQFLIGICAAICIWLLLQANSTTSLVSLVAAVSMLAILMIYRRLSPHVRSIVLPFAIIAAVLLVVGTLVAIPVGEIFGYLGKDETMSGRTGLWEAAMEAYQERPVLGYGYQGFWIEGRQAAELLWDEYVIPEKTGFHFHNAFVQILIDTGAFGIVLFVTSLAAIAWSEITPMFGGRIGRRTVVYLVFTTFFISRMASEIDFYYQFTLGTFLFYAFAFKAVRLSAKPSPRRRWFRSSRSSKLKRRPDRWRPRRRPQLPAKVMRQRKQHSGRGATKLNLETVTFAAERLTNRESHGKR